MLARVFKPRLLLSCLNRVLILQSLLHSKKVFHVIPTLKFSSKSKNPASSNFPSQWTFRHYSSMNIDPFEEVEGDEEERKLEESDDDSDDTIYFDVEDVKKKRVVVPVVELYLPLIVIDVKPLFPRFSKVIVIYNPQLVELVRGKFILQQPYVGVFMRKEADFTPEVVDDLEQIYDIGAIATIKTLQDFGDCLRIVVKAQQRVRLKGPSVLQEENATKEENLKQNPGRRSRDVGNLGRVRYNLSKMAKFHERMLETQKSTGEIFLIQVEPIKTERTKLSKQVKALKTEILAAIKETSMVSLAHRKLIDTAINKTNLLNFMSDLSDFGAAMSGAEPEELQQVMSEINVAARMRLTLDLLRRQINVHKLQKQIAQKVEQNVVNDHREVILKRQLKEVIAELGISSMDSTQIAEKLEERLKSKCVPKNVQSVINDELIRLRCLDVRSEAFCLARNYLDWLTALPWGVVSAENLNLELAAKVLDEDHYGMEQIKRRILEFIAASQLRGDSKGSILCIHGPPGVGKTSIAGSIARALNRKFFNFSVGGLRDAAAIKGHRRTYVGAMPGKVIQCLKNTNSENPLILLDEVDKIGNSLIGGGEAASAMLELLDPEQNKTFLDHFIDVPVDLSRVFFVCTAKEPDLIPTPLKDRMELLSVAGFTEAEKQNIATKYLVPKILRESGISEQQFTMTDDALATLISGYCRESSVRKLQQKLEKILRKVAFKLVKGEVENFTVTSDNLKSLIGKLSYRSERLYQQTPVGVVMNLACTTLGGVALYIETTKHKILQAEHHLNPSDCNCDIHVTGNLGAVMAESAQIALTVARNFIAKRFQHNNALETQELHLNVPSGNMHKDGASAGVSISTALVSLAIDQAVPQNLALTGEISLTGRVLGTQDIEEKVVAAKRNGISCLILPRDNQKDYKELPEYITQGLKAHFVGSFEEVYRTVFET